MERESFENPAIAALMNEHFVCIKVDREERPDLDEIYMAATLALNEGQGGWPMTVFLTPAQEPIFAGTYFPPTDRYGRIGFPALLEHIARLWREDRGRAAAQAAHLGELLRTHAASVARLAVSAGEIEAAAAQYARQFDPVYGGFGSAPKFPPATGLMLLLRHHRASGDGHALEMVRTTLDAMARGGMYDHVGGGFARYSTDERWLVPHFEKMLYDNALLAKAYLEAFQVTAEPRYRQVATEILDYVLREMTGPEGGFYSATDADSEGEEGKFYVWTPREIETILGQTAARAFCAYYDISPGGNWEGHSIPNTPRPLADVAAELGIAAAELEASLARSRALVYEARQRRVPPGLDDKVLTAWNGLTIGAMAEGHRVLGDPRYLAAATRAASFLLSRLTGADGGLLRTYRGGTAHLDAYLEDYAYLADALIDLYEAGGDEQFLAAALRLGERCIADFGGTEGEGFYSTARGHEALLFRHREGRDGATPGANAVAASALARLAHHLDRPDLREAAAGAIEAHGAELARHPVAYARALCVVDFLTEGPVEIVLAGAPAEPRYEALRAAVAREYLPNRIVGYAHPRPVGRQHRHGAGDDEAPASGDDDRRDAPRGDAGAAELDDSTSAGPGDSRDPGPSAAGAGLPPGSLPLLAGKGPVDGGAALYVCRNYTCAAPITDPAAVAQVLGAAGRADVTDGAIAVGTLGAGRATPAGTAAHAARFRADLGEAAHGPLGASGLAVSRLGFGGYRIDDETPGHRTALEQALLGGVNLVDTSTNYTDGASERLVGSVLAALVRDGRVRREEIVVVSKIGYVQGQNLLLAQQREAAGRPFPEMVQYMDGCWHCIHPDFLADQLRRSLARLGLGTLDVCLLHNPEYFLSDARRAPGHSLPAARDEFYRRLGAAFGFFEAQVAAGTIGCYGVSSNSAAAAPDDPEATSLTRMLEMARSVGGPKHHFRVLQLPMNLFEAGGVLVRNNPEAEAQAASEATAAGAQGDRRTVLETATAAGVGVLLNRPLNAVVDGGMIRLASVVATGVAGDVDAARSEVAGLEEEFRRTIAPRIRTAPGSSSPDEFFRWSERLMGVEARVQSIEQWQHIESQMIVPTLHQLLTALDRGLQGPAGESWQTWRARYLPALERLLGALRTISEGKSAAVTQAIAAVIDPLLPPVRRGETLSRKALWVAASTPGVSCVLNGMRSTEYVTDALGTLSWSPLADVLPIYQALSNFRPAQAAS
jgi:hypothetical protein